MRLPKIPKPIARLANAVTNLALLTGIPRPPYTRGNALIVETVGRRSRKRHRVPVGYIDEGAEFSSSLRMASAPIGSATRLRMTVDSGFTSGGHGARLG